jgi:hypothetical protein
VVRLILRGDALVQHEALVLAGAEQTSGVGSTPAAVVRPSRTGHHQNHKEVI